MTEYIKKEIDDMCNLSQGIMEKGVEKGIEKGKIEMILKMYNKGYALEQIADIADKNIEEIKAVIYGGKALT